MLRRFLPISLLSLTLGTLAACGHADEPEVPTASTQGELALAMDSDGRWDWADRRAARPNLRALWGSSANDVWAVGNDSATLHWDGTAWRRIGNPGTSDMLQAVWGTASNNVYAVGDNGLALRWNGAVWRRLDLPVPTGVGLNDIWGSAANDLWVVGDDGIILRYNGTSWSVVPLTPSNSLWTVWGSAANNVWIAGDLGFMLRWNGTDLTEFPSGGTTLYTRLRGANGSKMWLLNDNGTISAWDGMKWGTPTRTMSKDYSVTNLWVVSETQIWSLAPSSPYRAFRWNGTTATEYTNGQGNAIWTVGTSDGWVVGDYARLVRLNAATNSFEDRW